MIAVCIATYNNESFIAQAIDSVLAQQCDEPLRIYIGDDASTDGTRAVCERYAASYPQIRYTRHPQNKGVVSNTLDLYRRIMADGCEYIAMLDGDDYWTDPHKLQLQLDYLKQHPEIGWLHTAAYDDVNGKLVDADRPDKPTGDLSQRYDYYGAGHTNCTVLFRTDLLREADLQAIEQQCFLSLDYPLYGIFSQYTQFGFLYVYTAAWRKHHSVSHPRTFTAKMHYTRERIRMWYWLDKKYSGHFHFHYNRAILRYIRQFFYILFA